MCCLRDTGTLIPCFFLLHYVLCIASNCAMSDYHLICWHDTLGILRRNELCICHGYT
uniref:Uncharacterized protein n=1 Tax=Arundo donax TaxID=35708 RepID=A0A0A8YKU5_ARUDO